MISVTVSWDEWNSIRFGVGTLLLDDRYCLSCGLSIPFNNVSSDRWLNDRYIIRFTEEKDATWFVLAYGGEVYD